MWLVLSIISFILGIFAFTKAGGSQAIIISLFLMLPLLIYIIFKKTSHQIIKSDIYNEYRSIKNDMLISYNKSLIKSDKRRKKLLINEMNKFLRMKFHIPYYVELDIINHKSNKERSKGNRNYNSIYNIYKSEDFWLYQFNRKKDEIQKILNNIKNNDEWPEYDYIMELTSWDVEYKD